ncbi:3-oxoacyl-[acyl-carrier protein] reductase [Pseudonocardia hierapolitana]|uniref:3-oxoacyl-[acyl-carrier protein] reductase n=1 Tax=Pseudonocardia hierapolitana TaxID=1128676 RepID=A0A561SRY1_9PSEU|nr:SDR family oxidoreductase [Pseudonocardia hierapolitana]TWF77603.1 3-oxoacyl-[acyl-carrier protein] reductase [Pseudonocardia hierapolitana]
MSRCDERAVLVTGASRGIGAGIARELLRRGRRVAGGYRTAPDPAWAGEPDRVLPVRYDLADDASAAAAVRDVTDAWGRLDGVICNAGCWRGGRLTAMDPGEWWRVVEVNVRGSAALARAALPALAASRQPSIVLVSSVVGLIGHAGDTAYASAKAALVGFARSLAKEVAADGVRVNVLAPGFVDTDMTAAVPVRSRQAIADATLLGRFGTVEEIARAATFLSEDATFCTGTVLTADGGWSL